MSGELRNAPRTSRAVTGASITLGDGSFGELRAPRLLHFYGRDADNLNASYDVGDQVVLQFDMAVSAANCTRWDVSVDNYRYCARRPEGGMAYVDSLFTLTGALGANYSGAWEDGSTFVITTIDPPPALAPR